MQYDCLDNFHFTGAPSGLSISFSLLQTSLYSIKAGIGGQTAQEIFRKRKDLYRRQRDLSIFAFIGVYLLSVIDAYVDAELSDFDISKDLGLKIEPVIFNDGRNKIGCNAIGLQCSLKF